MTYSASSVMMVRPAVFGYNPETAGTNSFQKPVENAQSVADAALDEFDRFASLLRGHDIDVVIFQDPGVPATPDSIFPNNWVSFHPDGKCIVYPMLSQTRRQERRLEWANQIGFQFGHKEYIDLTYFEKEGLYLEGTGSVVFDYQNAIAWCNLSPRSNKPPLDHLCHLLNYEPVVFHALDKDGNEVYHTNVLMSVGESFAVVCVEAIADPSERGKVEDRIRKSGKDLIAISQDQMHAFCGNILQLRNLRDEPIIVLSESAAKAFDKSGLKRLEEHGRLVVASIPCIEKAGGGSVRCMITAIHHPGP